MNFIYQISVKKRIVFLVFIPLIATVFFATERYKVASDELENVNDLEFLQQYISVVSPLISSLQQERLYSKLYMGPGNPNDPIGKEFKPNVTSSRVAVDVALSDYQEFISDRDQFHHFPSLLKGIDEITVALEKFNYMRENVDRRLKKAPPAAGMTGKYFWTFLTFNSIIKTLNSSSNDVVLLASENPQLSLLANSYRSLVQAQDTVMLQILAIHSAITRGLVTTTFSDIMQYRKLEESYLNNFFVYAPNELQKYVRTELTTTESFKFSKSKYQEIRKENKTLLGEKLAIDERKWLSIGSNMSRGYQTSIDQTLSQIERTKNRLSAQANSEVWNTIFVLCGLLLVLGIVSTIIINSINRPLKQLIGDLTHLAETKDMTLRSQVTGNNELSKVGEALNTLIETFEETLRSAREKVHSMDSITLNVSQSVDESLASIESQRASTNNISVAVNQMTSTIHEVATMSTTTSDAVGRAYDLSVTSEQSAQQSKNKMDHLFGELGDTSQVVGKLNTEANQISNILQVIRGISEQTNLLALNAAIEAARAGESGRGFAVVADEVRELSKRTHDSTDQIQAQIESLITGAAQASQKMLTLQTNCQEAVDVVQASSAAFITIKSELNQITDMASQIAVAAEEQTNVADEINERIHGIKDESDELQKQGASTGAATLDLLHSGNELKERISVFHV
ncbi:methyl-accepting chemotaxis protein [Echinimonas agarilytica]|uniref:Methyl-accepting chemotaxis protein n=1 Tax=Echinimonas agarilytica TaxID=1215918 RepID=A0AA41W8J8_9GAMM|nr:methyl-accepting chemotaxis protein [Echinimonas agarilytica]MCM2680683.1 methyl-accepting chemotaxis protein [Echinimonas agarilytica]